MSRDTMDDSHNLDLAGQQTIKDQVLFEMLDREYPNQSQRCF